MNKILKINGTDIIKVNGSTQSSVVLLHGYGANFEDLVPLSQYLDPDKKYNWYFPNGICPVEFNGIAMGRSWFDLRVGELEHAFSARDYSLIDKIFSPRLEEAAEKITGIFKTLQLNPETTVIGGFSQGAMMATQLCLSQELSHRLIVFSGAFANPIKWPLLISQPHVSKMKVVQTHGLQDQVLPFAFAEPLQQMFSQAKLGSFSFESFNGGHEIPLSALKKAASLL